MYEVKIANRFGRPFRHDMKRIELKDLEAGDHIVEERYYTYWHHMIVDKKEEVYVIHYNNKKGPSGSGSVVCRDRFSPSGEFYRIVYKDGECLSPEEVVKRANERVGESAYNPLTYNCQHFATECKTGRAICHQMWTPIEILLKSSISTIASFVAQKLRYLGYPEVHPTIAKLLKGLEKHVDQAHPIIANIYESCFAFFGGSDLKAQLKKMVAEYVERHQLNFWYGVIISTIFEVYYLYSDYSAAQAKSGEAGRAEIHKANTKRIFAAVCSSIGGSLIWFYVGNRIKYLSWGPILGGWGVVPILGTIALESVVDCLIKVLGGSCSHPLLKAF